MSVPTLQHHTMEGTSRRKLPNDMSKEELISVVVEKAKKLEVAEALFKAAEEEKQGLMVRISQMIDNQKKQLDGGDGVMEKIIAERDLLKKKALELISRGKAAQAKIAELSGAVSRYQSELRASEESNEALRRQLAELSDKGM